MNNHHVPPFIEDESKSHKPNSRETTGLVTMVISALALGVALLGAGKLVYDVLGVGITSFGENPTTLAIKLISLGLVFGVGLAMGLLSLRVFNNQLMTYVVYFYCWVTLGAVCAIYLRIIYRFYTQNYDEYKYFAYMGILFGAIMMLSVLHLIVENYDLRFYSFPILLLSLGHLFTIVYHYVFSDGKDVYFPYDLISFAFTFLTGILMLAHIGIFNPARNWVDRAFTLEKEEG